MTDPRPPFALARLAIALALTAIAGRASAAAMPTPDHVVVVFEENHAFSEIIGSSQAPYINRLASEGALFTQSYALSHPSLPNYLQMFSGSNQGITGDSEPHAFTTQNVGAAALARGLTFAGFAEDLPAVGSLANYTGAYDRDHCPWVQWQDAAVNGIPAADNRPFNDFPSDFTALPTLSFVTPNLTHIMHDSDGTVAQADIWLHDHLDAYAQWAKTHASLLIVRWDEDDGSEGNRVAMIIVGARVAVGTYAEHTDHYSFLRTIEDMYGLTHSGAAASASPITDCWTTDATTAAPAITAQPADRTVAAGSRATFSVTASGVPAPTYQWLRDGVVIPGATNATWTTSPTVVGDDGASFRVVVTNSAGSVTSTAATLHVTRAPRTRHYAAGHNFSSSGAYTPGAVGFDLADVSSVAELDALPDGVLGLVWLGLGSGADATFIGVVTPFIGHAKLFGFYLMDEPDPTGNWAPLTRPQDLLAESDWIHAHVPGAKTFIVLMDLGSFASPSFAGGYTPDNTHIDLFGLDPYPCRTTLASPDYQLIDRTVAAAIASGVPVSAIVPVYQAFGGGDWHDNLGGGYAMPTVSEENRILAEWAALVPAPAFDYAYSWGSQMNDESLEGSSALKAVFAAHQLGGGGTTGGTTTGGTTSGTTTGGTTSGTTTGGTTSGTTTAGTTTGGTTSGTTTGGATATGGGATTGSSSGGHGGGAHGGCGAGAALAAAGVAMTLRGRARLAGRSRLVSLALLMIIAGATTASAAASPGVWTSVPTIGWRFMLLTDGSIMTQVDNSHWSRIAPDATGQYDWAHPRSLAASNVPHDLCASVVMRDGRVFIAGGENSGPPSDHTAEIYDPLHDSWTIVPNTFNGNFADCTAVDLPDGRVLAFPNGPTHGLIYDPIAMTWTTTSSSGFPFNEDHFVLLPGGTVFTIDQATYPTTAKYIAATDRWVADTPAPTDSTSLGGPGELGQMVLLYDGRVMCFGGTIARALFYTPAADPTSPGSWSRAPAMPDTTIAHDYIGFSSAADLPNGHLLIEGTGNSGHHVFDFDPAANAYTDVTSTEHGPFLILPTGQLLATGGVYTPTASGTNPAWLPTISGIAAISGGYRLTGTQLTGLNEGAYCDDDEQMSSNYPLVRLTSGSGAIAFARTANHSTMAIRTGSALVSTDFTLPTLADGDYQLQVVTNGLASVATTVHIAGGSITSGGTTTGGTTTSGTTSGGTTTSGTTTSGTTTGGTSSGSTVTGGTTTGGTTTSGTTSGGTTTSGTTTGGTSSGGTTTGGTTTSGTTSGGTTSGGTTTSGTTTGGTSGSGHRGCGSGAGFAVAATLALALTGRRRR